MEQRGRNPTPEHLAQLRRQLVDCFDSDELKTICFDIGVDYQTVAGSGAPKTEFARKLIAYLVRRDRLGDLLQVCERERPQINWREQEADVKMAELEGPLAESPKSIRSRPLNIFLSHSSADLAVVHELYNKLKADSFNPWLDAENLLAGQEWEVEITKALRSSDVIVICSTQASVNKTGYLQKEIRFALDRALEQPEGAIFIIPLKLEPCELPDRLNRYHWIPYYKQGGYESLLRSLEARATALGIQGQLKEGK